MFVKSACLAPTVSDCLVEAPVQEFSFSFKTTKKKPHHKIHDQHQQVPSHVSRPLFTLEEICE